MCIYYILSILVVKIMLCMAACNNAEYEIDGECCPMCDPGNRVEKHCDTNTSTSCDQCLVTTYTDIPNGLTKCLPCLVCDESIGLRVKQECTLISNTVCEPLLGYYCIGSMHSNCHKAMKHSTCIPGKYVNQTGTEFSDTVCDHCPAGSYSNGTLCKLHTKCESLGKIKVKAGTETFDAECSNGTPRLRIGMSVIGIISSAPSRKRMDPIRSFRPPASLRSGDLLAPPPAFESNTPPRPVDASPSPWLLPSSAPPETLSLKTPPGSLVPQAPTWSDVIQPTPAVSPGSPFPLSPPSSSVAPPPSQSSGSRIPPRMLIVPAQARSPDPAVSVGLFGFPAPPGSPSVASPSAVPRVAPLNSPLWRFPSLTPPWGLIMVGLWTNIWLLLLQASPWLLLPSTPPWTIFVFCELFFYSSALRPPPEPPPFPPLLDSIRLEAAPTRRGGGGGRYVTCTVL
ncbi:tumor necrosis factor receptor superfamily member 3-like isoform X2 [Ctenopharyngodon idella]|uniref:tumor necrosis factor receptor superfamily member 3-like isoform X2 n=1 Tax=Ctenopharyngodon idella TaxID=7959 RepID=UPI00222E3275|nr:tumor necrosis factor receptor superfamily member 3-like isoform X2 [Ctenopharyngodon idella]